jgi:hypothetical protein
MATKIRFEPCWGKTQIIKLNKKARGASISFNIEGGKMVIRSYWDNKVLQRATLKGCTSGHFYAED